MRYILYGMGGCFREYFLDGSLIERLRILGYLLVGVADKSIHSDKITVANEEYPVVSGDDLKEQYADRIVIVTQSGELYDEISVEINNKGIEKNRISILSTFINEAFFCGNYKYNLSAVCIVKWEEDNIYEWIEYHRIVGFEHFYIYDNGNSEKLRDMLLPYTQDGVIDLIEFPGEARQIDAYNDAVLNYLLESKYIAFIDADEFIYINNDPLFHFLEKRLNGDYYELKHTKYIPAGVGINWRLFGTSDYKDRCYNLVTESHLQRSEDEFITENGHIKTITNPRCVEHADCHYMKYFGIFKTFSPLGTIIEGPFFPDGVRENEIRIYHYAYKSVKEIRDKYNRGYALKKVTDEEKKKMIEDAMHQDKECLNLVRDEAMLKFQQPLKESIKRINSLRRGDINGEYLGKTQ